MTTTKTAAFDPAQLAASFAKLNGAGTQPGAAAPAKDKATIYLAVGIIREEATSKSAEEFDPKTDVINLPQLIGLDNMNHDTRRAGTVEFATEQAEKNALLDDLVADAMAKLAPGETRTLPFVVTIYRKKDEVVAELPAKRTVSTFL